MAPAVRVLDVTRQYVMDGETVHALRGVTMEVPVGDYVAIMGTSGSGKSTLLNLIGCLDRSTSGRILLGDEDLSDASDDRLSEIRASHIGFVFQSYNLIPQLTVLENIEVPWTMASMVGSRKSSFTAIINCTLRSRSTENSWPR